MVSKGLVKKEKEFKKVFKNNSKGIKDDINHLPYYLVLLRRGDDLSKDLLRGSITMELIEHFLNKVSF